uniref:Uncharacterized protein n=1 Tax=Solanum lycopersicum TaxID=4081 RepID=K4ASF2_SOLLC
MFSGTLARNRWEFANNRLVMVEVKKIVLHKVELSRDYIKKNLDTMNQLKEILKISNNAYYKLLQERNTQNKQNLLEEYIKFWLRK